jgi:hypothetical protein
VHQGGGVERLTRLFVGQLPRRQFSQFVVNQRQQLRRRGRIAGLYGGNDTGDFGHGRDFVIELQSLW